MKSHSYDDLVNLLSRIYKGSKIEAGPYWALVHYDVALYDELRDMLTDIEKLENIVVNCCEKDGSSNE